MKIGPYIPILRWKEAERQALSKLFDNERAIITPLIEPVILSESKSVEQLAESLPAGILECWGRKELLLDPHLLGDSHPNSEHTLLNILRRRFEKTSSRITPVTGLSRSVDYQEAITSFAATSNTGVCIRLFQADFMDRTLSEKLEALLKLLKQRPSSVDLLLDFRSIFRLKQPDWNQICGSLPNITSWRNVIAASGAFPRDLTETTDGQSMKPGVHRFSRTDWTSWEEYVRKKNLPRSPLYADYATQWALVRKPIPVPNISASIRYTCEDAWLVMRGEGMMKEGSSGAKQYLGHAKLLVGKREFCGASFSAGDAYIEEKSRDLTSKKTGNARTWLEAGINHHLTFAARQVANQISSKAPV